MGKPFTCRQFRINYKWFFNLVPYHRNTATKKRNLEMCFDIMLLEIPSRYLYPLWGVVPWRLILVKVLFP